MSVDLKSLTRRQLEDLQEAITKELRACVIDDREGAESYLISRKGARASILLCKPCFEKYRLPKLRASEDKS